MSEEQNNQPRHWLTAADLPWLNQKQDELTLPEITDPVMRALSQHGPALEAKKKRRKGWINPY